MSKKELSLNKNIVYNLSSTLMSIITLFILTPFIINNLGSEEYGIYIILGSIIGFLGLMEFGLGSATIYYLSIYLKKDDYLNLNKIFSATFYFYLFISIFVFILIILCSDSIINIMNINVIKNVNTFNLIFYSAISFLITFISSSFISVPQVKMRFDLFFYIQIIQNVFRLIFNILSIYLGFGLEGLIFSNIIVSIIYLIISIIISRKVLPELKIVKFDYNSLRKIFSYGIYSFLSSIIGLFWKYSDTLLISYFLGPLYVAFFSVPQQIMLKLLGLINSVGNVLFPKFSSISSVDERNNLYLDSTYIMLNVSVLIFVPLSIIFGDFLSLWISKDFSEKTYLIGIIIASSSIIRGAFIPYQALFQGIGKPKYLLNITILSTLTVIIGDLILIPKYGINGAAYALLIAPVWGVVTIFWIFKNILLLKNALSEIVILFLPFFVGVLDLFLIYKFKYFFKFNELNWLYFLISSFFIFFIVLISLVVLGILTNKITLFKKIYKRT